MQECIFCVLWGNFYENYQNSHNLRPLLSHYRQVKHIICKSQPIVKGDLPMGSKKSQIFLLACFPQILKIYYLPVTEITHCYGDNFFNSKCTNSLLVFFKLVQIVVNINITVQTCHQCINMTKKMQKSIFSDLWDNF